MLVVNDDFVKQYGLTASRVWVIHVEKEVAILCLLPLTPGVEVLCYASEDVTPRQELPAPGG